MLPALLFPLAAGTVSSALALNDEDDVLKVDPLLLAQAAQVWEVIANDDNPIWPGWNAASTPLLFYFPGVQDVLVNHPSPPSDFVPFVGEPVYADFDVWVRSGRTEFDLDGQNTARSVGGVSTLVLADTLSNRRNNLRTLLAAARAGRDAEIEYSTLATDCYSQMGMIAHEAFHVHQQRKAGGKGANEQWLLEYPVLSAANNVGVYLEGEALARALETTDADELRQWACAFLAARERRRSALPPTAIQYEDGTEFNEGLANYVEWALLDALSGRSALPELYFAAGFHGFDDLDEERAQLVRSVRGFLSGERIVNDDPYGTASVRFRLYWSGMAIGALLESLGADWKERIFEPSTTLTEILDDALSALDGELADSLGALEDDVDLAAVVEQKQQLAEDGAHSNRQMADDVLDGAGTTLLFDHSQLDLAGVGLTFTPFGIRRVDESRLLYTQIPVKVLFPGHGQALPEHAYPVLQNRDEKWLALRVGEFLEPDAVLEQLGWESFDGPARAFDLQFDGISLSFENATLSWSERRLTVRMEPKGP